MSPSSHWSDPILYPWLSLRKKQKPKRKENIRLLTIQRRNARKRLSKHHLNCLKRQANFRQYSLAWLNELKWLSDIMGLVKMTLRISQ